MTNDELRLVYAINFSVNIAMTILVGTTALFYSMQAFPLGIKGIVFPIIGFVSVVFFRSMSNLSDNIYDKATGRSVKG